MSCCAHGRNRTSCGVSFAADSRALKAARGRPRPCSELAQAETMVRTLRAIDKRMQGPSLFGEVVQRIAAMDEPPLRVQLGARATIAARARRVGQGF